MFQNLTAEAVSWKKRKLLLTNGEVNKWIPVSHDVDLHAVKLREVQSYELVKDPFEGGTIVKSIGAINADPL